MEDMPSDGFTDTQTALLEESDEGAMASSGVIALAGGKIRKLLAILILFVVERPFC